MLMVVIIISFTYITYVNVRDSNNDGGFGVFLLIPSAIHRCLEFAYI